MIFIRADFFWIKAIALFCSFVEQKKKMIFFLLTKEQNRIATKSWEEKNAILSVKKLHASKMLIYFVNNLIQILLI